jgi:DNA (cytosine-5)-methyltransferase 1
LNVLDLFCGAGGLSSGFKKAGFRVTGIDKSPYAGRAFTLNGFGDFKTTDLSLDKVEERYDVIVGGPPCRPWSNVNLATRGKDHKDYNLVSVFFEHVERLRPKAFLFENVIPVAKDETFLKSVSLMEKKNHYSVRKIRVKYSDYGAATKRERFFAFGLLDGDAGLFEEKLRKYRAKPKTVRDKIWTLREKEFGTVPDHRWPKLNTIEDYRDRYESGQYGWYVLRWDEPAPSFGNVMKTYILHPESFNGGVTRVISVREAYLIMGFDDSFRFAEGTGLTAGYQMTVDSVSPVFSKKAAKVIKQILLEAEN